jgi:hypothetical protein
VWRLGASALRFLCRMQTEYRRLLSSQKVNIHNTVMIFTLCKRTTQWQGIAHKVV